MFQSFDTVSNPAQGPERVARLRAWMAEHKLDGVLVPRADEHQGEYVAARSERLQWLTGFTGSAGVAVILSDRALVFVDGRYALQARHQLDCDTFSVESLVDNPPAAWLGSNLRKGERIGFDPWLHTIGDIGKLRKSVERCGGDLLPLAENPVDAIWSDQPGAPLEPVTLHPVGRAGALAKDKLAQIAEGLKKEEADHAVLTDPSSLAWAFNIRGHDVPHAPLTLGFAIVSSQGPHLLFLDERKFDTHVKAYLTQLADLFDPSALERELIRLAKSGKRIALDPALAAERLRMLVEDNGGTVVSMADPARLPRATKNEAELSGARAAHRRDGAAMAKFLAWLDGQPAGTVDEIGAVVALEECRRTTGEEFQMPLRDVSFPSISGAGPNGAVIHYRVTTQSNRQLEDGELFLIDSGAQYEDGTTDVTRTIALGAPTEEMRERYTIVLKGLIALSLLRFPPGTRGVDIDALARVSHWKAGIDYAHGTGHGVGSYLSVHEGPQRIAKTGSEKLLAGMIVSNEPGYYKQGYYGIRLENLIAVTQAAQIAGGETAMHGFETLTLVPFDRRLIRIYMLTDEEHRWLDDYHARVLAEIGPLVDGQTRAWLEQAVAPLG
jgi:Xaa-Pro aminopeptidase